MDFISSMHPSTKHQNYTTMKTLSLFLTFCLISILGMSQSKNFILKGQVSDPHGNPIACAKIFNQADTLENVQSDKDGLFVLESKDKIETILVRRNGMKDMTIASTATFVQVEMAYAGIRVKDNLDSLPTVIDQEPIILEIAESSMEVVLSDAISYGAVAMDANFKSKRLGNTSYAWTPKEEYPITESYSEIAENDFHFAQVEPLSTFSIDVDRASYANVRRFINNGSLPQPDAVRVEEMINYFNYDYDAPKGKDPVSVFTEVSQAPWNNEHQILHIGIKAKDMDKDKLPPSNLVFLIDVSGSMNNQNKLPLLKSSMKMLVQQMRKEDRVAIVVYAGAAGLVLEPTSGDDKQSIFEAIDNLNAGGSTAGGAGIKLAYKVAQENLVEDGNNRIVLATDGDFNVGASSDDEMETLIESKRDQGVFLTVLGFGMGNYKDSKMEILADKGNGNYAYIDNITEAKKTLVNEFGGTMFAVAKDVKLQIEFNPSNVAEYRLIGYENRMLAKEDFNDDRKDAGEMGVSHVVTALYEIVPFGKSSKNVDALKYQKEVKPVVHVLSDELVTVKLRYKEPDGDVSKLMTHVVKRGTKSMENATNNLKWSSAMAQFGMLLKDSKYTGDGSYASVIKQAESAIGKDPEGYRRECVQLMKSAELLDMSKTAAR
jgi:Ca-activated chloride channel homolog